MKQTIGIRFSRYGQVLACLYDTEQDAPLAVGESALVMTERGLNCGQVVWQRPWQEDMEQAFKAANVAVQSMSSADSGEDGQDSGEAAPMPSARRATEEEKRVAQDNAVLAREAHQFCRRCIAERRLDMKLVDVEILFDRSKMVFFFTAPDTLDDDLAGFEPVEGAAPASHEPSMMNSEEASHRRKKPHHHPEAHEKNRRSRPPREPKERASDPASGEEERA